ncbi:MAG: universal stress protein, partial [Actinomycetota bacterium]|nr:universal stress protein [Actinomycetota bacterium]
MLRSVLIPTDFSLEAKLLLGFVEGLGACGVESVVLGHIVEASGMEGPIIAKHIDKVRERVGDMAEGLREAGLAVEIRIGTGEPSSGLLALAAEAHVDGVVCGTHGKGTITKFFSGSVSEDLLRGSFAPTMLIRYALLRNAEETSGLARRFGQKLVLPTDFSSASMRSLMA